MQDAAEAYEQLCRALTRIIDCLPRIELYTQTFLDSSLVRECVNMFYVSVLRFCRSTLILVFLVELFWNLETCLEDSRSRNASLPPIRAATEETTLSGARACKFYRRRRLWNVLRIIWNDFDTQFSDLEVDMERNRDKVESK